MSSAADYVALVRRREDSLADACYTTLAEETDKLYYSR